MFIFKSSNRKDNLKIPKNKLLFL